MSSQKQYMLAILGVSLLVLTFSAAAEQMGQDWVARYDGNNSSDYFCKLAVDDNGFVYVAGVSSGPNMEDFAVIKYWPNGDTVWVRRYDGPGNSGDQARALALDESGNAHSAPVAAHA